MQRCQQETPGDFGAPSWSRQKKIVHFSSGETLELEDSEEEEEEEEEESNRTPFREPAGNTKFSFRNLLVLVGRISLLACDFLGERLAGALGLNAAKYQFAVDQFHRDQKKQQSPGPESVQNQDRLESVRLSGGPEVRNQDRLESVRLSGGLQQRRYGAAGDGRRPADAQEVKGCENRGYQEDNWNNRITECRSGD